MPVDLYKTGTASIFPVYPSWLHVFVNFMVNQTFVICNRKIISMLIIPGTVLKIVSDFPPVNFD